MSFRCLLEQGNPKPTFSWFKNGEKIRVSETVHLTTPNCSYAKEGVYLVVKQYEQILVLCGGENPLRYEKFSGRYSCLAVNEMGSDEISSQLNILGKLNLTVFFKLEEVWC